MSSEQQTVLITPEALLHQPGRYVDILKQAGLDIRYPNDQLLARGLSSEQETIDELRGMNAVVAGGERLTARVIDTLPELRVISRVGVGYDRVDVPAATTHGIPVTITPSANHEAVAEQALALLFAVQKAVVVNDRATRAGQWPREPRQPVRGNTLGIVGLGRIGRSMAVRSLAMGMPVIAMEMYPDEAFVRAHGIELVDLDTLLGRADVVSLHCPLTEETRGLFNVEMFAKMKPGSVLINTARGGLVVEADLLAALESGHLRGAGLDVFEQEPPSANNPLFRLDSVVVSPHIAGADVRSLLDMAIEAAENVVTLFRGDWPTGAVVNDELRASWTA